MTIAATQTSTRYQPLAQIGGGGMAEVILAEMQIGRGVTSLAVLKRLWPELAEDPDFVAMFLREARLCARMNHPNVVRTYEIFEDAAGSAIAMEYLDGQPLSRVLNRLMGSESLSLSARLRLLIDVLAALDYAHELRDHNGTKQGIVHRDVNPQNVFVTYDGLVKLLDFGVAKSAADAYKTRPGELRGKLAYLAPEQALGEMVDRRADLFSVGVMLWEMVTGRRMWQSMTEASIMRQLTAGRIPPLPRGLAAPPALADICARALARSPERRFASAGEFATELQRLVPVTEDARGRHLGRVVGLAFGPERAARRTLIEEHQRRAREACRDGERRSGTGGRAEVEGTAAGASWDLPALRPERPTPGGMWTLNEQDLADAIELGPEDTLLDVGPPPAFRAPPSASAAETTARVRRTMFTTLGVAGSGPARWMAVGFAVALAVGGAVYAGGAVAARAGTLSRVAAPPPIAATVSPAALRSTVVPIVGSVPVACGISEGRTGVAPPALAAPGADPAPGIVPVAPTAGSQCESVPLGSGKRRRRLRGESEGTSDSARNVDATEGRGRSRANDSTASVTRGTHFDDETLEPTIDLSGASAVAMPASAPSSVASNPTPPASRSTPSSPSPRRVVRPIDLDDPFQP